MTILIGLTGKARSGKDTTGAYISAITGATCEAFANALKIVTAELYGIDVCVFYDDTLKDEVSASWGITHRKMLQDTGMMVRSSLGSDFWVNRLLPAALLAAQPEGLIVTDVRFDNEAMKIREMGGYIVEITRSSGGLAGDDAMHASERRISDNLIDASIANDGTFAELQVEIKRVLAVLR